MQQIQTHDGGAERAKAYIPIAEIAHGASQTSINSVKDVLRERRDLLEHWQLYGIRLNFPSG